MKRGVGREKTDETILSKPNSSKLLCGKGLHEICPGSGQDTASGGSHSQRTKGHLLTVEKWSFPSALQNMFGSGNQSGGTSTQVPE